MWAPHRLVSLFRHLVISSSCHPAILSCPETSVSLLRRGRGVGWVVYVVVDKSVTYDQHIKYQQSHMTGIPVLTGIPVTPWKRVRCCVGTAIRNPYLYPSIPVTGYPRCYLYPCHSLNVDLNQPTPPQYHCLFLMFLIFLPLRGHLISSCYV